MYSVVIFVNFVYNFSWKTGIYLVQMKHLIHLTGKKKCFFLLKNCGIMKPCKNSAFFLDVFFYINFLQSFRLFSKTRGVKLSSELWSRGSRLASGNYHEDLGPVASFWRQQTWKSAMFLASLAWLKIDRSTSSSNIV
jgi:hypothetical protein